MDRHTRTIPFTVIMIRKPHRNRRHNHLTGIDNRNSAHRRPARRLLIPFCKERAAYIKMFRKGVAVSNTGKKPLFRHVCDAPARI